jgi:hypothetical protein
MKWVHLSAIISLSLYLASGTSAFASEHEHEEKKAMQTAVEKSAEDLDTDSEKPGETRWLTAIMAKDINGSKVVNDAGDEIGEVVSVVRDIHSGTVNAVVSVGGFLGIGEKEVAIPLKDLEWREERLIAPFAGNEQALKSMPAYNKTFYEAVPASRTVGVGLPVNGPDETVEP